MFKELWPGFDASEVPIGSITNGVHAPTWVSRPMRGLAERRSDPARRITRGRRLSDEQLLALRRELRSALVDEVRRRLRVSWEQRGASPAELGWVDDVFDPDVLTIGFARRVPSYKRLTLMLSDPERLKRLLLHPERPIQLVIAGKAHPADDGGKELVQQIVRFADAEEVRHRMVFLPDYDIGMARFLYGGCDVWLNNPLRPLEACGTSGMKSALNGGLNLSIRDGWWDEMFDGQNGWAIPTADGVADPVRRDHLEAAALYDLIENNVAPKLLRAPEPGALGRHGAPHARDARPQGARQPDVAGLRQPSSTRPPDSRRATVSANGDAGAKRTGRLASAGLAGVAACRRSPTSTPSGVGDTPSLGGTLSVRAVVSLGALTPSDVEVQARLRPGRRRRRDHRRSGGRAAAGQADEGELDGGDVAFEGDVPLANTGSFGYAVRVLPHHPLLASEVELGLMAVPRHAAGRRGPAELVSGRQPMHAQQAQRLTADREPLTARTIGGGIASVRCGKPPRSSAAVSSSGV